jgi:Cytochrome c554 and c-prime/Doubled CXXCH motif (Paired_CXXCH_1)
VITLQGNTAYFALILSLPAVAADGPYAGSEACAPCHRQEYDRQVQSHHALALHGIAGSPVAELLLANPLSSEGLQFNRSGAAIRATARRGQDEASADLEWVFGAGVQGITPVGRTGDQFIEFQFSLYSRPKRFAVTFGHPKRVATARALLGLPQDTHTIRSCFQCHSTGLIESRDDASLDSIEPGVRCERCHGPGRQHILLAESRKPQAELRKSVLNPSALGRTAQVQWCGQCHRLPAPGVDNPEPELEDPVTVRFAPIGLMASRCFRLSQTLTCTTCHNPHQNSVGRTDPSYARTCLKCHADKPRSVACKRAAGQNCLPCHMRQASVGEYLTFTDHRIRIY